MIDVNGVIPILGFFTIAASIPVVSLFIALALNKI